MRPAEPNTRGFAAETCRSSALTLDLDNMRKLIIALALVTLLSGCGTFIARTDWRHEGGGIPAFYPASYVDGALLVSSCNPEIDGRSLPRRVGVGLLGVVDLPVSVVTDTLCLPLDIRDYFGSDQTERKGEDGLTLEQRRQLRDADLREQAKSNQAAQVVAPKVAEPGR